MLRRARLRPGGHEGLYTGVVVWAERPQDLLEQVVGPVTAWRIHRMGRLAWAGSGGCCVWGLGGLGGF